MLIACWGVPGRSYPDNGKRCLAAAVEVHASLLVKDMKTSMGVTTGHVSAVEKHLSAVRVLTIGIKVGHDRMQMSCQCLLAARQTLPGEPYTTSVSKNDNSTESRSYTWKTRL